MTTDEAKEKWCPMVQVAISPMGDIITNRMEQFNTVHCMAELCAFWVWEMCFYTKDGQITSSFEYSKTEGHCGLMADGK